MKLLKTIGLFIAQKCEEIFQALIKPMLRFVYYIITAICIIIASFSIVLGAMTIIGVIAATIYPSGFLDMIDTSVNLAKLTFYQWAGFYCLYGILASLFSILIFMLCWFIILQIKDKTLGIFLDYLMFNIPILIRRNWYKANLRSGRKKYFYVVPKLHVKHSDIYEVQIFAENKIYTGDELYKCNDLKQKNMIAVELTIHDCEKTIYTYKTFSREHRYEYGKIHLLFAHIRKEYRKRKFKKK